jgi:far upstream element-binding protein
VKVKGLFTMAEEEVNSGSKRERDEADASDEPSAKATKTDDNHSNAVETPEDTTLAEPKKADDNVGEGHELTNGTEAGNIAAENAEEMLPDQKTLPSTTTQDEVAIVIDRTGDKDLPETGTAPDEPLVEPEATFFSSVSPQENVSLPVSSNAPSEGPGVSYSGIPGPAAPAPMDPMVQPTVVNPEQIVEEYGELTPIYVARVIGKGGDMIRDLQARSGARIDVDQKVPTGQPRRITYRGTRKAVDFAKSLVRMITQEGVSDADLPLGEAKREIFYVPDNTVGKIIGYGGEMIRKLQAKSQSKIQVEHHGGAAPPGQKQVTITGTVQAVDKGTEMVLFLTTNPAMDASQALDMLIEEKLRGSAWGSGPPYTNMPNQGINMQPQMAAHDGGYGGGVAYTQQGYQQQPVYNNGGGGGMYGAPQQPVATTYPPQQATHGGAFGIEVDVTYAQKQFMGRVIGQKGVTINDLQRRSGTDIQINQDVTAGQDCQITIKGSRQGIEMAKQMIAEIIEVGPQHPYAGGMDSSGYGTGGGQYGGYQQQPQQSYGYQQPPLQQAYSAYQQPYTGQQGYNQAASGYGGPAQAGGYAQQYSNVMPAAPTAASLPPPPPPSFWKSTTAPGGQIYYYNERTGETQWDKPAGMP